MRRMSGLRCLAFIAGVVLSAPMLAEETLPTIPVHRQSGLPYVHGGVGALERKAMLKVAKKYPIRVHFTREGSSGDLSGVKVKVKDARDKTLIELVTAGPLFFFEADSGRWKVEAEYEGEMLTQIKDLTGRRYLDLEFVFKRGAQ